MYIFQIHIPDRLIYFPDIVCICTQLRLGQFFNFHTSSESIFDMDYNEQMVHYLNI